MKKVFEDENVYWPFRWLKIISRFPHEYETWLTGGHTIPNGENADPFADNTKLGCMILFPSLSLPETFFELQMSNEKKILFHCLFPIYKEEMELKLKKGVEALMDGFEKYQIRDVVDINRVNVALEKKKKGLWGLW
jgi:hypothetical protein